MSGFESFDDYLALPRVTGLALSVDGTRLVAAIGTLDPDAQKFVTALWELDPTGAAAARRLTRSDKGESAPVFHPDGSLLFVSGREGEDDDPAALWRLPVAGEAERVLTRSGGVDAVRVAGEAGTTLVSGRALPGAVGEEADATRRKARKDANVKAVLHTQSPVRFWDHDLGPDELRLFVVGAQDGDEPRDLTPAPGRALDHDAGFAISRDGTSVVSAWYVPDRPGFPRAQLRAIDLSTGAERVLADDEHAAFDQPAISPDGTRAVCVRTQDQTVDDPPKVSLWLIDLASGESRELVADPDVWPGSPQFAADGSAIFFLAAERGQAPVFRVDVGTDEVTRVTASGHYASLQVAPDGKTLYALRDGWDTPPRPVRLDATGTDGTHDELPAPGGTDAPGRLERVSTTAEDGTTVEAWLAVPDADGPAPLVLFIHGGPLGSWNGWSWRWNPWLLTAKGYAVLLPDPALSVGYGADMIQRGWHQWGGAPFTDLMAITDAVVARPDIDETRTAAAGGSYGGYMANWVAGHTDRFRCIVTHASLWALDQFSGTTDVPGDWALEFGLPAEDPEFYRQWSPHVSLDRITTPMLVVHGDMDYRVPIGEGLRLWWDLQRQGVESAFLYFPDEGHWILKPGNARTWYEALWGWLGKYLLDAPWTQPSLL